MEDKKDFIELATKFGCGALLGLLFGVSLAISFLFWAGELHWFVVVVVGTTLICGVLTLWHGERFIEWWVKLFWWI
jgi:predicted membrane-bound spermidine synthase